MNSPVRKKNSTVNTLSKLDSGIVRLSYFSNIAAQVMLASMMSLISVDVVLRYFFNRPIKGSYELVEFLMVGVVFLGLAYTQTAKGHVSVTLLTANLSAAQRAVLACFKYLLALGIFAVIFWRCIIQALSLHSNGVVSGILRIPTHPFMWIAVFGCALLCLVFFTDLVRSAVGILKEIQNPFLWLFLIVILTLGIFSFPVWLGALRWDITNPVAGLMGIVLMMTLIFSDMLVATVMAVIGFIGFAFLVNWNASLAVLGTSPYTSAATHGLTTIPLFILMGSLCFQAELSKDIYTTLRTWAGRLKGGLAISTVGGCAGFAAVSGSSMATAVTMGTIAIPEMRRYKYDEGLACGCVAAGGSIGILIPPSIAFIIIASLTEMSIGKLFIAGIIPGLLEAVLYITVIYVLCTVKPEFGPSGPSSTFREKIVSLKNTWGILVLFILVIGGIYGGLFTPTEAAGVGSMGALLLGLLKRKLNLEKILLAFADAIKNTAMLMIMIIGADILKYFLTISQIPFVLSEFVIDLPVSSSVMIWAILLVYILLGAIMPIFPAIILTIPIFFPVVVDLGYNPLWFGVMVVTTAEIGQITPPVGLNVFALAGVAKNVPLSTIFRGIFPFVLMDIFRIILLFFFPALILFLPSMM